MLILKAQNVVSEGIPIVYVYQMHQQNGSFAQNVDSEDIPGSTNGVNKKARNNKLYGDRAPPTSTNVLIYKMGWPPRLQFLAPFHISCNPDINKVGNRSYMSGAGRDSDIILAGLAERNNWKKTHQTFPTTVPVALARANWPAVSRCHISERK